jgi:predicted DNA-binding antitoxin AbrB/MazE fold protein
MVCMKITTVSTGSVIMETIKAAYEAVYQDGVFQPLEHIPFASGTPVHVALHGELFRFLEPHPTRRRALAAGAEAERIVCELVRGQIVPRNRPWDVLSRNGTRLQVKVSKPHLPSKCAATKRWLWSKVLTGRSNEVDRLVLLGSPDPRYHPPDSYLFFDVPMRWVMSYTISCGQYRGINLTTHPTTRCRARGLWAYEVTAEELAKRYGN